MPQTNTPSEFPRLIIEQVTPILDAGRYPIKRRAGSHIDVGAAIFKDGHDLIAADLVYRGPGDSEARRVPLNYRYEADRWYGMFHADRAGRWQYWIEAWPDAFGTFSSELKKRVGAGQDVRSELLEGAALLLKHAEGLSGATKLRVLDAAHVLKNPERSMEERLALAFSEELVSSVRHPLPGELCESPTLELISDPPKASFSAWYELFPRSESGVPGRHGTFADTERRLPELAKMGFEVLYLPPIHPIGHTHRKGRNNARVAEPGDVGSPWAIGSEQGGHDAIHPDLGSIEDFRRLVRAAGELGIDIALDFALQCSPDHPWCKEHPEWFFIRPDGSIRYAENPPKKYEDIYPINFWCENREALWNACRDVLFYWIENGVRVFRVDNPHTKPLAFWEWVIREVHLRFPDVIFLSESFTRPNRLKALAKLGFNQSYTYFTWKNSSWELKEYMNELIQPEMLSYFRPNFFANTPDILHEYLQVGGRPAFRIRLVLAATLSPTYGIYSGYELCENVPVRHGSEEYLDSEKYELKTRNYDAPNHIKEDILKLNRIRRENPALHELGNLRFCVSDYEGILAYRKSAPNNELLICVNLDPFSVHETMVHVPIAELGIPEGEPYEVFDLLTHERYVWRGSRNYVRLDPAERVAHVFRISPRPL
ncbi:MAG TPA: alpha-1,4-glucan--maltose-1-phosphate maltosyltransferase [Polyangiaceae bacterium]|nr:alpha-1,4-glucan--maltose-1-phosphate maltosyltransferase [Polyangiaceae bacterium]